MRSGNWSTILFFLVRFAGQVFFWGQAKTTGEATMYPKPVQDLRRLECQKHWLQVILSFQLYSGLIKTWFNLVSWYFFWFFFPIFLISFFPDLFLNFSRFPIFSPNYFPIFPYSKGGEMLLDAIFFPPESPSSFFTRGVHGWGEPPPYFF